MFARKESVAVDKSDLGELFFLVLTMIIEDKQNIWKRMVCRNGNGAGIMKMMSQNATGGTFSAVSVEAVEHSCLYYYNKKKDAY